MQLNGLGHERLDAAFCGTKTLRLKRKLISSTGLFGMALTAAALSGVAMQAQQQAPNPCKPIILPEANRPLDANQRMEMRDQQSKKQNFEAANAERRRQIAGDSAKLLKLANDLKAEMDKTDKDTLSVSAMRKADAIERLAHNVKEKMKLTVGVD